MRLTHLLLPVIVVASSVIASAGEHVSSQTTDVAPFVEPLARAIVCIDLKEAEVTPLLDLVVPKETQQVFGHLPLAQDLEKGRSAFLDAGIDRLYFVVSLADMPSRPWYLVAPCTRPLKLRALLESLPDLGEPLMVQAALEPRAIIRGNATPWFFLGSERAYEEIKTNQAEASPDLTAALLETDDSPVQILLLPSDDDRRVMAELVPTLPESLGGGPSGVVARGFRWAAVQLRLKPEPKVRIVVHSADHDAAEQFRELLVRAIVYISRQSPQANSPDGPLDEARVNKLFPRPDGNRLEINLRKSDGMLAAFHSVTTHPWARLVIERTAKKRLMQIVRGMHSWHDEHESLPRQANYDADGKPLLSWRVHLLPYLGGGYLQRYTEFHLDEPWDSEHNLKLLKNMPDIYIMPGTKVAAEGRTCFVRPVGPETSCPPDKAITVRDIKDGTVNTIAVVEVDDDHAVPWTKPADLQYDPEHPTEGLGGHLEGAFFSAFCDASAHMHRELLTNPKRIRDLRAIFTRSGRESVRNVD